MAPLREQVSPLKEERRRTMNRNLVVVALVTIVVVVAAYLMFWNEPGVMTEDRSLLEEDAEDNGSETEEELGTEQAVPDVEIEPGEIDPVPETAVEEQELLQEENLENEAVDE
jgi:hypothetical protein